MTAPTLDQLYADAVARRDAAARRRRAAHEGIGRLLAGAQAEQREHLTASEFTAYDRLTGERDQARRDYDAARGEVTRLAAIQAEEDAYQRRAADIRPVPSPGAAGELAEHQLGPGRRGTGETPRWVRTGDMRPAVLERGQRFADHPVAAGIISGHAAREQAVIGHHGGFGQLVRAMTTTSGSAIVPTLWAADIIDRARNKAAVTQAGAQIVPMDSKTLQIGRLTADPTAGFRTEGSPVTASDPVFDSVTLTAKTLSALVVGSMEWFADATNVDQVVSDAVAQAIALQLDYCALFGGVTAGGEGINLPSPPNPVGILANLLANAPSSVLGSAANGTAITATTPWNEVLDTVFTPQAYNETPNAILWNAKMAQKLAKSYDTTGQPLRQPDTLATLPKFVTNQIPSFTQGTMTNIATDVVAGDFAQLIIGQRLDLTVQTLTERYAENGQVGILAHWRGDVQLARPRAFCVYRYLGGS